ncbi:uncharacterized protein TNCV_3232191 [Trichonephila clavipes]|nr:uncharacterized protein TNCV_3232191 [Trichonephila clavipes]
MPLCRFRKQYEQLSQFERRRIIGMMEGGCSARRVTRQLGCSDCVVRSDESRFNLSSHDNRVRVWRPCGEHLNPAFALQRHIAPTAGVMVLGAIAFSTWSPLVLIRGTMTAQRYVHAILQPHILLLMQWLPGAIFQLDNALPHMARVSHKTVSALLLPFLGLPEPQIWLQSSISVIIWDREFDILQFLMY